MSDAPERVWIGAAVWFATRCRDYLTEYIRADIAEAALERERQRVEVSTDIEHFALAENGRLETRLAELEASLEYEQRMRKEREAWRREDQKRIAELEAQITEIPTLCRRYERRIAELEAECERLREERDRSDEDAANYQIIASVSDKELCDAQFTVNRQNHRIAELEAECERLRA